MNYLLVVDDSPVDRQLVRSLLEMHLNYRIEFASNGWEALEHIESQLPLVVITDLLMPEMDGLKLTETIHRLYKSVPVILMTAHGSEEIAAEALLRGAADYIPKSKLAKELHFAVRGVLELSEGVSADRRLGHNLRYEHTRYELENDMRLIGPLVDHFQITALQLGLVDHSDRIRLAKALGEAIRNAMCHGNLELSAEETTAMRISPATCESIMERRREAPFCDRKVIVEAYLSPQEGKFVIRDEGPGFDTHNIADILKQPSMLSTHERRGLVLIRAFMDDIAFNEKGNEITLVKRKGTRKTANSLAVATPAGIA